MFGFDPSELRIFRKLNTPAKIQDFLNTLRQNFDDDGDYLSPRRVLRQRTAQCMEGAMFAATALRMIGYPPLVVDLKVARGDDDDHVIAVFKEGKHWGALSKTNHGVLRYREPVYESIRELVMSYFHEYFLHDGRKTLRSFSNPIDLSRFDKRKWMTTEEDLQYIADYVDHVRHVPLLTSSQKKKLRRADVIERKMGTLMEWRRK